MEAAPVKWYIYRTAGKTNQQAYTGLYNSHDFVGHSAKDKSRQLTNGLLDEADSIQRSARIKDRRTLDAVNNILQQTLLQPPTRMYRSSSVPPPRASSIEPRSRLTSPSPYDQNQFYFLPTSHLHATPRRNSVAETQKTLDDCRNYLRRSDRSRSVSDLNAFQSDYTPTARRALNHAYGHTTVQRVIRPGLPRAPVAFYSPNHRIEPTEERRKIERRMDSLVNYEMPSPENFTAMKASLRSVNDKLNEHRRLLDRYASIDMTPQVSVGERVEEKYQELISRMPELERNNHPGRRSSFDLSSYSNNNYGVKGYSQGLLPAGGPPVSEIRGRIRRMISRSRQNPHYYRV